MSSKNVDKYEVKVENDEEITRLKGEYKIIQKKSGFKFSIDAVLVADFFEVSDGKILDIGTGNGIIPILLVTGEKVKNITGIDIQNGNYKLAEKNVKLNKLEERIKIVEADVKEYPFGNFFDHIISNPPYMSVDGKKLNQNDEKTIARHEVNLTLEEFIKNAKRILKPIGTLTFIHRSYRFPDILKILEENKFSIEKVKFVYFSKGRSANLVLIKALKGKKSKFEVLSPLFLDEMGN